MRGIHSYYYGHDQSCKGIFNIYFNDADENKDNINSTMGIDQYKNYEDNYGYSQNAIKITIINIHFLITHNDSYISICFQKCHHHFWLVKSEIAALNFIIHTTVTGAIINVNE